MGENAVVRVWYPAWLNQIHRQLSGSAANAKFIHRVLFDGNHCMHGGKAHEREIVRYVLTPSQTLQLACSNSEGASGPWVFDQ